MKDAKKKFREWNKYISAKAWVVVALAILFSFLTALHMLETLGVTVHITPQKENSLTIEPGTVSIRGAFIDEVWYNPEALYNSGNWQLDVECHIYSSVNAEDIILRFPCAEKVTLIFDVGPDKGQARIRNKSNGFTYLYNCNYFEPVEYGWGCELPAGEMGIPAQRMVYRAAAVVISLLVGVFAFALCVSYEKRRKEIRDTVRAILRTRQRELEMAFLILLLPCIAYVIANISVSSTPRLKNFYGYDAAWYWYAGDAWRHGYIPYIDTNLNKGPLVFFIYMIGSALGERWGMYILQCLAMWVSLIGAYLTGKMLAGRKVGALSAAGVILAYMLVVDEGGLLEEFNLPFLMFSIYFIMKYMLRAQRQPRHPPAAAAFYGLTFGVTLYSRVTDSIFIDIFVFCICVYLLIKKEYKNLLQNALAFIAGLAVIVLPFLIYFAAHGALPELLEMYISNFRYAGGGGEWSKFEIVKIAFYLWPVWMSMLLSVEQRGLFRASVFTAGAVTVVWLYRSFFFLHYYVITLAFVPVVFGLVFRGRAESGTVKERGTLNRYSCTYKMMVLVLGLLVILTAKDNWFGRRAWIGALSRGEGVEYAYMDAAVELAKKIPAEETDSVMGYEIRPEFMLATHIQPCYKIVNEVEWWSSAGYAPERAVDYANALETRNPKWLVVQNKIGLEQIRSIVEENYTLNKTQEVEGYSEYTLYLYERN